MKPFAEIPYTFLKENYFLISLKYRTDNNSYRYEFPVKNKLEDFDGTIGEYVDMLSDRVLRENKSRDVNLFRSIHDAGAYIENLYDMMEGDLEIPLYYVVLMKLNDDRFRNKHRDELREFLMRVSPYANIKEGLYAVGYTIEEEHKYNFKSKLAINWHWLKEDYIRYANAFNNKPYGEMADVIRQFVTAIVAYKPFRSDILKWSPDEAFEKMFKYRSGAFTYDYADIAEQYGISSESIRQKMFDYMRKCADVLQYQHVRNEMFGTLHDLFEQVKSEIASYGILPVQAREYFHFFEKLDLQTKCFVEKFLQVRTFDDPSVIDEKYIYVGEFDRVDITSAVKELQRVFSKYPLPVNVKLDLPVILNRITQANRSLCQRLIGISGMFVRNNEGDSEMIMLKYKYLRSQLDRIIRILSEMPNNECAKSKLIDEYNRRAKLYGMAKTDELINEDSDFIEKIGRSGLWRLRPSHVAENKGEKKHLSDIVREYVLEQGDQNDIDFKSVVEYVKEFAGNAFKESSIRTTLNNFGYVHDNGMYIYSGQHKLRSVDIIKAVLEILNKVGKPMKRQQLLECLSKKFGQGVNYQTFTMAIAKANDLFDEEYIGREVFVTLKEVNLKDLDFTKYAKTTKTPDYHYEIIQTAIDELLREDSHCLLLRELKRRLVKLLPPNLHDNNIYKVLKKEPLLLQSSIGNIDYISLDIQRYNRLHKDAKYCFGTTSPDALESTYNFDWEKLKSAIIRNYGYVLGGASQAYNAVVLDYMRELMKADDESNQSWRIFELLNRLFFKPTTNDERELLAFKMVFELENFMRSICAIHACDVKEKGFIRIVNYMQEESLLPERYSSHKINSMIGRICSIRNNYAHKGNSIQVVSDTIKNFLEFYYIVSEYALGLIK